MEEDEPVGTPDETNDGGEPKTPLTGEDETETATPAATGNELPKTGASENLGLLVGIAFLPLTAGAGTLILGRRRA